MKKKLDERTELAIAYWKYTGVKSTQQKLANIFGVSQSTISRSLERAEHSFLKEIAQNPMAVEEAKVRVAASASVLMLIPTRGEMMDLVLASQTQY